MIDSARNADFVGGTFTGGVEIAGANGAIGSEPFTYSYATGTSLLIKGNEPSIDIVGSDAGNHGSSLLLRNVNEGFGFINNPADDRLELKSFTVTDNNFQVHATGSNVDELTTLATFNKSGTVDFGGVISATGGNSTEWNTGYDYSQVGHLPLAGGTLTGNLTLNSATPEILFNGTSDTGVDMAIKATPEGLDFYEPEDLNRIHFQILDDTGVNAPFGYSVGATQVIDSSGNVKKSPTLTLSGDVSGTATFTDLGNATLTATVANDSHNHTHSDGDFTVNGGGLLLGNDYLEKNLNIPFFTNGVSDLAVDVTLGNIGLNVVLQFEIIGGYSSQNTTGLIRRKWSLGFNPDNAIWESPKIIDETIEGNIATQIYVSDPFWDSSASTYKIRVHHTVSTGNSYTAKVSYFSMSGADNLLGQLSVGSLITAATSNSHTVGFRSRSGYRVGDTTVIDASRNLTSISNIGSSGTVTANGFNVSTLGGVTQAQGEFGIGSGNVGIHFNNSGGNLLPFNHGTLAFSNGVIDFGHPSYRYRDAFFGGKISANNLEVYGNTIKFANLNDSITFEDTNNVFSFNTDSATGNAPVRAGSYQVGTNTVIDASRNLTNIGTISASGSISVTGYNSVSAYSGAFTYITGALTGNVTGNVTGNASTATSAGKWTTAKTLSLTGDVTGSVSWDGSANASITTVVGNDSHNHTHSDGAFTVNGSLTTTGNIIMPNDNYVNRTFTMIENAPTQYILLCANAGSNDVNATIRIDRTSGNYQAVILDVIVTSGSATMFGGTLRTLQVIQNSEDYRLVSVTYGGNNWIAIKYTGNAYPMTFPCTVTGRIKSTLPSELTVVSSGITNEVSFGGNSESYQEVDNFVVSGDTTSSNGLFNGQLIVDGGTGVSSSGTLHLRQKGDTVNDGMAITSSNGTAHRIWKDASGVLNFGIGSIPNQFGMDTSGNFKVNGTTAIDSSRNLTNIGSIAASGRLTITDDSGGNSSWTGGILIKNTGSAGEPAIAFQNSTMGSNYWIVGSNQDDELHFGYGASFTDDGTKVVVKTDGKVGINRGAGALSNHLEVGGSILATSNITAYSDRRLKDNIKTLDGSKVYEMRGVSFTKDGELGSGVIAQELEQVAPELVLTNSDEMQTKSVAYGNVVGYLIEAIKELKLEIEELKNGNNTN